MEFSITTLALLVLTPFLVWRIYSRIKKQMLRQRSIVSRHYTGVLVFGAMILVPLAQLFDTPYNLAALVVGAVGGIGYAVWGLKLTRFEETPRRFDVQREGEEPLEPLGVVLFAMDPAQPRLHREVRADVEWELDGAAPVLDTFIRYRPRAARDLRRHGLVAGEYLRAARDARYSPAADPVSITSGRRDAAPAENFPRGRCRLWALVVRPIRRDVL